MRQCCIQDTERRARDTRPAEPLTEGIRKKRAQRRWESMSNDELVAFAHRFMEEGGICSRKELAEADNGLYFALRRRERKSPGIMRRAGFGPAKNRKKGWDSMGDDEIIECARRFIRENRIERRKDLANANSALYNVLRKRNLLEAAGLGTMRRGWSAMGGPGLLKYAQALISERGIKNINGLRKADNGLYQALRARNLRGSLDFELKRRTRRWKTDAEMIACAKDLIREKGIRTRNELQRADCGLYQALYKRNLVGECGLVVARRNWRSHQELIDFAKRFIAENGIGRRGRLQIVGGALYHALRMRNLLDKVGLEDRRRDWASAGSVELEEIARAFIIERGISRRDALKSADSGLYEILRKRGLLDSAFRGVESAKLGEAVRGVVDALESFGDDS